MLNDQQKIELGRRIAESVSCYFEWNTDNVIFDHRLLIRVANSALGKIQEIKNKELADLEKGSDLSWSLDSSHNHDKSNYPDKNTPTDDTQPGKYQTNGEKEHICGICYQSYSIHILSLNYGVCHNCIFSGKIRPGCQDKNGNFFLSGETLRNESSLTSEIKILKIDENYIYAEPDGAIPREDFVQAGWIVHERVTPFEVEENKCLTECKFEEGVQIGSVHCKCNCDHITDHNEDQHWVICKLYNKEFQNNNGEEVQKPK